MNGTNTSTEPVTLEFGRYRLSQTPDGAIHIARAAGTCETCQSCGCGEQAEVIHVPAMLLKMNPAAVRAMLGKLKKGAIPSAG